MSSQDQSPSLPIASSQSTFYSPEAVQAILSRALELRAEERYTTQQLQEMAAELNVSPELLKAAEADWRSQQTTRPQPQTGQRRQQRRQRQQWLRYAFGSAMMIGIDIATAGTLTWAIFPVLGWGLSLALGSCDRACRPQATD